MAWSSTACSTFLKLSPPTPSARPPPQIPRSDDQPTNRAARSDEASGLFVRRKLCAAGAATLVVIGLGEGYDLNSPVVNSPMKAVDTVSLVKPERSPTETRRWSDSIQGCPPWRSNSFQLVVPENLPRPSARRRWESVGSGATVGTSSRTVRKPEGGNPVCFSM